MIQHQSISLLESAVRLCVTRWLACRNCGRLTFLVSVSQEEAGTACKTAMNAAYDFWAEPALPGQDPKSLLLMEGYKTHTNE